ncbi:hypothetical protein FACS18949_11830 [Clostridia bacterium]|nr:hypothetical protein FACS18949_11830 [Clostridia bacterium]
MVKVTCINCENKSPDEQATCEHIVFDFGTPEAGCYLRNLSYGLLPMIRAAVLGQKKTDSAGAGKHTALSVN